MSNLDLSSLLDSEDSSLEIESQGTFQDEEDEEKTVDVKLSKDIFALSWLKVSRPYEFAPYCRRLVVVGGILMVLVVFMIQLLLLVAILLATLSERHTEKSHVNNILNDAVENMGRAGLPLLSEQDAVEICGDFGDDYNEVDGTFGYKKLPGGDWDIFNVVSGSRSLLDDAMFVMTSISRYALVFHCTAMLWMFALLMEAADIFGFGHAVANCDSFIKQARGLAGDSYDCCLQELAVAKLMGAFIVISRSLVLVVLALGGCYLLVRTHDIVNIVLNSVALVFVVQIDEWLFPIFAPERVTEELDRPVIRSTYEKNPCLYCVRHFRTLWAIIFAMFGAVILRFAQQQEAASMFHSTAFLCLFAGPTPDITQEYKAGFPVPGMCESLLGMKCSLPKNWAEDQCLAQQPGHRHPGCEYYEQPVTVSPAQQRSPINFSVRDDFIMPTGTRYEDWIREPRGNEFCKLENGQNVSELSDFHALVKVYGGLLGYFPALRELQKICKAMWSEHPAMEVDATAMTTYNQNNHQEMLEWASASGWNIRFGSFPYSNLDGHDGFTPFPRLRRFSTGLARYSAPVKCSIEALHKLFVNFENAEMRTDWDIEELQRGCAQQPLVVNVKGHANDLCDSGYACKTGFCAFSQAERSELFNPSGYSLKFTPINYGWGNCAECPKDPMMASKRLQGTGDFQKQLTSVTGRGDLHTLNYLAYQMMRMTDQAKIFSFACIAESRRDRAQKPIKLFLEKVDSVLRDADCQGWNAKYSAEDNLFFFWHASNSIYLMPTAAVATRNLCPALYPVCNAAGSCEVEGARGVETLKRAPSFNTDPKQRYHYICGHDNFCTKCVGNYEAITITYTKYSQHFVRWGTCGQQGREGNCGGNVTEAQCTGKAQAACKEGCDAFAIRMVGKQAYGSTYILWSGKSCIESNTYKDVHWNLYRKVQAVARFKRVTVGSDVGFWVRTPESTPSLPKCPLFRTWRWKPNTTMYCFYDPCTLFE